MARMTFRQGLMWAVGVVFVLGAPQAWAEQRPTYQITAEFDEETRTLTARELVRFVNPSSASLEEIIFHVYPNRRFQAEEIDFLYRFAGYFKTSPFPEGFDLGGMTISAVFVNGEKASFTFEGEDQTLLRIPLTSPLSPSRSVEIRIDFSLRLGHVRFGRLGWHEGIYKFSRWYPILDGLTDEGWSRHPYYFFHRPFFSDAANYDVTLTVPQGLSVVHTGVKTRSTDDGHPERVHITTPLPVREFTFVLSRRYHYVEEKFQEIALRSYYLDGDEAAARRALASARDLMKFYTRLFGPYPYPEFSIAPVHLGYGGEQMSNLIFMDTRVYRLPGFLERYFDFLVAHETGHQWFYNLVGMDEFEEMWLEEGLNSYFIGEYLKHKYGDNAEIVAWPDWMEPYRWLFPEVTFERSRLFRYQTMVRQGMDHPVVGELASFKEPSHIFAITYGKGSKIVAMLKDRMGGDAFRRVLRRMFQTKRHENLTLADFRSLCEKESGQNLSEIFDQWLTTTGTLDYAVMRVQGRDIEIVNKGEINAPFMVKVVYADGSTETLVSPGGPRVTVTASSDKMESVVVDPEERLLDKDRVNNHWPRRLMFHPVPVYWPMYDMDLFLPEDSYNLVAGPVVDRGLGVKISWQKPHDFLSYASTSYEFGENLHHSLWGWQWKNFGNSPAVLGVEVAHTHDLDDGDDDVAQGRVFYRRELWPAPYGVTTVNDHVTFYLARDIGLNDRTAAFLSEDGRNLDYSRRNEAVAGVALTWNRAGPNPDPERGYRVSFAAENAGHFLGAEQAFTRGTLDVTQYGSWNSQTRWAIRLKSGWGFPSDKELFFLGGWEGLRGFDRKEVRGSRAVLGTFEVRHALKRDGRWSLADHLLTVDSVDAIAFFDAGQSWFSRFSDSRLRKDAGVGLRWGLAVGSFLEKVVVETSVAWPINESDDDTRYWVGLRRNF